MQQRTCDTAASCRNGADGIILVHLLNGAVPVRRTNGTVLSDTDCTPDTHGISHCHNAIRLTDGAVLLVQEDHNMQASPCLAPGEFVLVEPASAG